MKCLLKTLFYLSCLIEINPVVADELEQPYFSCFQSVIEMRCEEEGGVPKTFDPSKVKYLSQIAYFSDLKQEYIKLANKNIAVIDAYLSCYQLLKKDALNEDCLELTHELEINIDETLKSARASLALMQPAVNASPGGKKTIRSKITLNIMRPSLHRKYPIDPIEDKELDYILSEYDKDYDENALKKEFFQSRTFHAIHTKIREPHLKKILDAHHSPEKEQKLIKKTNNFYKREVYTAYLDFYKSNRFLIKNKNLDVYKQKYEEVIRDFPFAIYFKQRFPQSEDIVTALNKRKQHLLDYMVSTSKVSVYESKRKQFLSNRMLVEAYLAKHPEYCKIANQVKANADFKETLSSIGEISLLYTFCGLTGIAPCLIGAGVYETQMLAVEHKDYLRKSDFITGSLSLKGERPISELERDEAKSNLDWKYLTIPLSIAGMATAPFGFSFLSKSKVAPSVVAAAETKMGLLALIKDQGLKRVVIKEKEIRPYVLDAKVMAMSTSDLQFARFVAKYNIFPKAGKWLAKFGDKLRSKIVGIDNTFTLPFTVTSALLSSTGLYYGFEYSVTYNGIQEQMKQNKYLFENDYRFRFFKAERDECLKDSVTVEDCPSEEELMEQVQVFKNAYIIYFKMLTDNIYLTRSLNSGEFFNKLMKNDDITDSFNKLFPRFGIFGNPEAWKELSKGDNGDFDRKKAIQIMFHYHQLTKVYEALSDITEEQAVGGFENSNFSIKYPIIYNILTDPQVQKVISLWKNGDDRKLSVLRFYLMAEADKVFEQKDLKFLKIKLE